MSLYRLRKILITALLVIAAFILQGTVFSRIPLLGCAPDFILILTFIYGYYDGKVQGMLVGLFGGLFLDVFFCDVIGYYALVFMVIGFVSGIWPSFFYSDELYVPILLLLGSDIVFCAVNFVFWHLLHAKFAVGYYMLHEFLPEVLLTFIAGVLLYKPVTWLIRRLNPRTEE